MSFQPTLKINRQKKEAAEEVKVEAGKVKSMMHLTRNLPPSLPPLPIYLWNYMQLSICICQHVDLSEQEKKFSILKKGLLHVWQKLENSSFWKHLTHTSAILGSQKTSIKPKKTRVKCKMHTSYNLSILDRSRIVGGKP